MYIVVFMGGGSIAVILRGVEYFDDAKTLGGVVARYFEISAEGLREPGDERICPEVFLNDEIGCSALCQTWQVGEEKLMKDFFADSDRGIGPDEVEAGVLGNVFGGRGCDAGETQGFCVDASEVECAFIDVESRDVRLRGLEREAERDWPPAASQIEKVSLGWRSGGQLEKNGGSLIETFCGKDAIGQLHGDLVPAEGEHCGVTGIR
jgi:hypothetical protein